MSTVVSLLPKMALHRSKTFVQAIIEGNNEAAMALVGQGVPLDVPLQVGKRAVRPLELTILFGRTPVALALIEAGAPVTSGREGAAAMDTHSPFVLASKRGNEKVLAAIRQQLPEAVFVELAMQRLFLAAQEGRVHEIDTLRRAGVDCRRCDRVSGDSALHRAAMAGHEDAVAYLVLAGCQINTCNYTGVTPADMLRQHHPRIAEVMGVALGKRTHHLKAV